MKSIYTCPYCGAKSFNPLKKAFTGGLHTKGKVCMECGQHCVNGKASMIFSAVVYIAALVLVMLIYFKGNSTWDYAYMAGTIVAAYVWCRIFDAFFGPLEKPIRNDVLS